MTFDVEQTMSIIRNSIVDENLNYSHLSYITPYNAKMVDLCKSKEQLVLFGAGVYGATILDDLISGGCTNIAAVCDNGRYGGNLREYEILKPEDAVRAYPDAVFVITPHWYENEIFMQLITLGVRPVNIVFFILSETGIEIE